MTTAKSIAGIVPGIASLGIMGRSIQMLPKTWDQKGLKKHSKNFKSKYIGGFVDIAATTPMVGIMANQVAALP